MGGLLLIWITRDLADRTGHELRDFDPQEVATLAAEMWRAYYTQNQTAVLLNLLRLLRRPYHPRFGKRA